MQHVRVFITREEKAGKLNLTDKEPKHVNYFYRYNICRASKLTKICMNPLKLQRLRT